MNTQEFPPMPQSTCKKSDISGTIMWQLPDGKLHRLDGPAAEFTDGAKSWYKLGLRHRIGGPAIEYPDGGKEWWVEGLRHRLDGPALIYADGSKGWWQNGVPHRHDGPAIEHADGCKEWYIEGVYYGKDVWAWAKAALKRMGIESPTNDEVEQMVQQALAQNILH